MIYSIKQNIILVVGTINFIDDKLLKSEFSDKLLSSK